MFEKAETMGKNEGMSDKLEKNSYLWIWGGLEAVFQGKASQREPFGLPGGLAGTRQLGDPGAHPCSIGGRVNLAARTTASTNRLLNRRPRLFFRRAEELNSCQWAGLAME